jgi:hypothetical protein
VDLCGPLWTFVDLCGPLWTFVDLCGPLWTFVDLCESLWTDRTCGPSRPAGPSRTHRTCGPAQTRRSCGLAQTPIGPCVPPRTPRTTWTPRISRTPEPHGHSQTLGNHCKASALSCTLTSSQPSHVSTHLQALTHPHISHILTPSHRKRYPVQ